MNKKQTAVEWFEQQLDNLDIEIPQRIFEEAKEMEKELIINAFETARRFRMKNVFEYDLGIDYYNETYIKEANYE